MQLGPLEMDERSTQGLDDARDLALVDMYALNQSFVIILGVEAVRRQARKVRDLDVDVGAVDFPACRLREELLQVGLPGQFFHLDLSHAVEVLLNAVET